MNDDELRVYYPYGGKHFILHWWTYDDRGHLILAKTERAIQEVAAHIFKEHTDAEIRGYIEADIVAPSKLQCVLVKSLALKERIDTFHLELTDRLRDALEAGKTLPDQFSVCSNYEPEGDLNENDWARETHYCCKNCYRTICFSMSKTDLYTTYYEGYRKLYPYTDYSDPKRLLSRAEAAIDNEELWFADAAFGHHSSGIDLVKVDWDISSFNYRPKSVLFFYRKIRDLPTTEMQAVLDERNKLIEEQHKRQEKERIEQRAKEKEEQIYAVLSLFTKDIKQ